jgi:hypothetical protein
MTFLDTVYSGQHESVFHNYSGEFAKFLMNRVSSDVRAFIYVCLQMHIYDAAAINRCAFLGSQAPLSTTKLGNDSPTQPPANIVSLVFSAETIIKYLLFHDFSEDHIRSY